ncbi:MAG: hypothetical protein ACFE9L_05420 [Candidatus Hodarchaeota archaeon]
MTKEEFEDLIAVDLLLERNKKITEPPITPFMQENNTSVLRTLIERHKRLYQESYSLTYAQWEEIHYQIPIDRVELKNEPVKQI